MALTKDTLQDDAERKPEESVPSKESVDSHKTQTSDVSIGKWYGKPDGPIAYVISNGIMNDTGDGSTFEPDGNCTREMFVQILNNAEGKPSAGASNYFLIK